MKFCIFGAGAIGGYLAVELALSGQEVCVIARGEHLQAIRRNGLKLLIGTGKNCQSFNQRQPARFRSPRLRAMHIESASVIRNRQRFHSATGAQYSNCDRDERDSVVVFLQGRRNIRKSHTGICRSGRQAVEFARI
jgi:choline dehydrogenase-like flavoprotein